MAMFLCNHLKVNNVETFINRLQISVAIISCMIAYVILGYFFEREHFFLLLFFFTVTFIGTSFLIGTYDFERYLFSLGVFFRLIFLFSLPFLSQDFYRFIWDGHAVLQGINPYVFKPESIIETTASFPNAHFLISKMGGLSASHFSNYPPINQYIFAISAAVGGESILVSAISLRVFIIAADIGIYYFGRKILRYFDKDPNAIFCFFLNPLVIIELTGNLHFEGVMLFFLIVGLYYLISFRWIIAAIFIALSISLKLIPLLFLPIFWKYLGLKKGFLFSSLVVIFNLFFFFPFVDINLISSYSQTIALWFINFEFNAGFYYLIREIGFYYFGFNGILFFGPLIAFVSFILALFFGFGRKNKTITDVILNAFFLLTFYFLISTTVHPWYVVSLIVLSVFTRFRFSVVWSYLIIVSYCAYSVFPFHEDLALITAEYALVLLVMFYEIRLKKV
jgi:alpha-1,6-mannosyltransferase